MNVSHALEVAMVSINRMITLRCLYFIEIWMITTY